MTAHSILPSSDAHPQLASLHPIARKFVPQGQILQIQPFGNGNINDTFLVTLAASSERCFVLQRINTDVFRHPHLVMRNIRLLTDHIHDRAAQLPSHRRWEMPRILPTTHTTADHWDDGAGCCWRAISFIEGSQSLEQLQTVEQAQEVGYALGMFHRLTSDLPLTDFADTLEGFHITPHYLQHYHRIREHRIQETTPFPASPEVNYALQFIHDRQAWAQVLEQAKSLGKLPLRLIHGDPKVNNILLDRQTQQAISLIDLDTVKPGLVHYDIGDCLRSGCNRSGEETEQWQQVEFDLELCAGLLRGYCAVAKTFLTEHDYAYLFDAVRLLAFELGLRFFTDYLAGNLYFKVKHPEHNLARALVQFKLTERIEAQEAEIRTLIQDLQAS